MIATGCNLIKYNKRKQNIFWIFRRLKSKKTLREKLLSPCAKALNHFDDFYGAVFLKKWPSIRLGLLSRQKQLAVINNFGDVTETKELLKNEGALDLRHVLNILKQNKQRLDNNELERKNNLSEIIQKQRQLEMEEALNKIFPKDKDLQSMVLETASNSNNDNNEKKQQGTYDPEDPKTSLRSDLSVAQIDTRRLILPNSEVQDALLQDFIPATELRGLEEFIPEADYYKYYQSKSEMPINIEDELDLNFPENLQAYTFNRGDMTEFSEPVKCVNDVYNYLKVDGADLLTALALNVEAQDKVLDFCSSSGNIAYCIFQTLPQFLACIVNKNIENLFSQYLFDYSSSWKDLLLLAPKEFITQNDNVFDKVLVNVPSTEDKLSVFQEEDNIFRATAIRNRLELPKIQSSLLAQGLKLVKPGGTVVYSTSTMSPVQNDGVVNDALTTVWQETKMEFTVRDLSPALAHMSEFFHFADYLPMKFGTLVVPFLPTNFGPRYFCKILKNNN